MDDPVATLPTCCPPNHPTPMAKKKSSSWVPEWLKHRALLTGEVLLVVGVVQEVIQRQMLNLGIPSYGKVLWLMACTLGVLGVLLVVVQAAVKRSLSKTHDIMQAIPLPTPLLIVHTAIYVGLFYLYAWMWDQPIWPLPGT
jgi:hypothetical protein